MPPIPFSLAQKLAKYADEILGLQYAYEEQNYSGDIGLHFRLSSSLGHKGRLIATVIRLMRPGNCLELGTCYGMGSMCILSMLERNGESGKLTTVERFDPISLAKERLHRRYGDSVSCHKGNVQEVLPDILNSMAKIDFVFHDASHTKQDYIRDFSLMEPYLASGCIVLIDDIRWGDPRFFSEDPKPYEGWLAVVGHDRVVKALKINNELELILLLEIQSNGLWDYAWAPNLRLIKLERLSRTGPFWGLRPVARNVANCTRKGFNKLAALSDRLTLAYTTAVGNNTYTLTPKVSFL